MDTASRLSKVENPKWMTWTGRVLSAVPALCFVGFGAYAISGPPEVTKGMAQFGYSADLAAVVGMLEIASAVLYAIPPTAVMGALFMTAYLGGAVATHVRLHDPGWPMAVITAVLVWAGLYLRDPRIRELLPVRKR